MKNSRLIYWQIFMADSYCYYYYIIIIVTAANYNATLMLTLGMTKHQTGIAIVLNDTISKWHKCYSCAKALSSNVFGLDFFKCMPTIITWVFLCGCSEYLFQRIKWQNKKTLLSQRKLTCPSDTALVKHRIVKANIPMSEVNDCGMSMLWEANILVWPVNVGGLC